MFMVQENAVQKERLDKIYKKIELVYGTVPPQMKVLGSIEADYVEDFLKGIVRVLKHPHIAPDLFAFLRLYVAYRESYPYCKMFNSRLLLSKGYRQEILDSVVADITLVPFDERHQRLAEIAIKAIYESEALVQEDLEALYGIGWSQKDVFDAIAHTGEILKNGRILKAYAIKELS